MKKFVAILENGGKYVEKFDFRFFILGENKAKSPT